MITYSPTAINARLQSLANALNNGILILLAGAVHVATVQLAFPFGTVNGGVLTFGSLPLSTEATGSGVVTEAIITDSSGTLMIEHLTVGVPPIPGFDVYISNGHNTTEIDAGQVVQILSAQIQGE